ncbi:MAG: hypothetical protein D6705_06375 [Deltaproteobacteria bacterium]|nr:MAG: hypothetical protein D6705_06375 [Deltaproteobacteria bacterium]
MHAPATDDTAPLQVPPADPGHVLAWNAKTLSEARILHRQLQGSAAWWGFLGPFGWDVGALAVGVTINGRTALVRVPRPPSA